MKYASIIKRFFALLIDMVIIWEISFFISSLSGPIVREYYENSISLSLSSREEILIARIAIFFCLQCGIIGWLYCAGMESSKLQATIGKRLFRLVITDLNGNTISFIRATKRWFLKVLSGLIFFIGFIISTFNSKKQALHDIISRTLVVEKV